MNMKKKFNNSKYTYANGTPLTSGGGYHPHRSTRYLNYCERIEKHSDEGKAHIPNLYDYRFECCGCSACEAICPKQAICMEPDEEGFLYPVVDLQKCVECYQCERVCAFKNRDSMKE